MVFFIFLSACFLVLGFFALRVKFEEDISKILPKDKKIEKLNQVFNNSKFMDKLVVTISLKDSTATEPDSLVSYADNFVEKINADLGTLVGKINAKVDDGMALELFGTISDHLPIYLTEKDYLSIDSLITPEHLKLTLEQDFRTLTSPSGIALKSMIAKDPVGISFLGLKKLQQLQYDENFELYDNYVVTKDQRHLMLFITPAFPPNNTAKNELLLNGLDRIADSLSQNNKSIETTYFGATAVAVGNALQLRRDSLLTQGITVVFLIVFFGIYFRKKLAPVVILLPVVFGALFSLAAIYFIKGSISVIALGTGSVVLGIAVNYSLHVFNHYRHTPNIRQVISDLAQPLTIGSLTTIGGFLCLSFVESEMLKDLGLFAAFSLIGASFCSLVFLPQLVAGKKEKASHVAVELSWLDKLATYRPEYNKYFVFVIFGLTFLFAWTSQKVSFDSDMLKMNFMSDKLKKAESKLNSINQYALQSVYLVTEGKTLDEALVNNEQLVTEIEQLKAKNIVGKYSGVSALIISDSLQRIRINRWNQYWTPEKKEQLLATLQKEGATVGFKSSAFDGFSDLLNNDFQKVPKEAMADVRKNFLDDYITEKKDAATVVTLLKVPAGNKKIVYDQFENNKNITVVDKQYLTGKLVEIINADFSSIAWMSSILVFTVLLITYGRIELTLVSFIPMFITWVWILGIMGMFGIQFNIVNIIISALIFGLGDDYSLFIMDGLLKEYKTGRKNLASYKSSIFLSAITTIAGLGVLIFAKHPALRSIAMISIIGIVCVVVMSQILIPFFFNILIKKRTAKKLYPWTLLSFMRSVFAFGYFVIGSLLLTVLGVVLIKLNFINKEKGKYIYHFILAKFAWTLVYMMGNIKKQIINPLKEDFKRPAVIICNHLSSLDILLTVMLYPKLILLTNKWVWNSPIFGFVVRMADYYPVTQGVEPSVDQLAERVKQGYSIVVFPEGTRSKDGNMKRFHKGAFYLAEQLNIDILPIVIHGSEYTAKDDFMLRNGKLTLEFLPRIKPQDVTFGTTYAEKTKYVGRYFRLRYQQLRTKTEQPVYYRHKLVANYIYKGPVLEWYMKVKIRLEKYYQPFHELLPLQGKILDIGCGYGFMSHMLHFAAPLREITGIDYDEEKTDTANHCFSKEALINFSHADALSFPFENYDAIIMADMLHYLQPAAQRQVIEKCILHLNPGGVIIIRDGNKDLEKKHKGTKLTEFFSTKLVGFNKTTADGLSFLSGSLIREIASEYQLNCREIDNTRYTSNMMFVLKKDQ